MSSFGHNAKTSLEHLCAQVIAENTDKILVENIMELPTGLICTVLGYLSSSDLSQLHDELTKKGFDLNALWKAHVRYRWPAIQRLVKMALTDCFGERLTPDFRDIFYRHLFTDLVEFAHSCLDLRRDPLPRYSSPLHKMSACDPESAAVTPQHTELILYLSSRLKRLCIWVARFVRMSHNEALMSNIQTCVEDVLFHAVCDAHVPTLVTFLFHALPRGKLYAFEMTHTGADTLEMLLLLLVCMGLLGDASETVSTINRCLSHFTDVEIRKAQVVLERIHNCIFPNLSNRGSEVLGLTKPCETLSDHGCFSSSSACALLPIPASISNKSMGGLVSYESMSEDSDEDQTSHSDMELDLFDEALLPGSSFRPVPGESLSSVPRLVQDCNPSRESSQLVRRGSEEDMEERGIECSQLDPVLCPPSPQDEPLGSGCVEQVVQVQANLPVVSSTSSAAGRNVDLPGVTPPSKSNPETWNMAVEDSFSQQEHSLSHTVNILPAPQETSRDCFSDSEQLVPSLVKRASEDSFLEKNGSLLTTVSVSTSDSVQLHLEMDDLASDVDVPEAHETPSSKSLLQTKEGLCVGSSFAEENHRENLQALSSPCPADPTLKSATGINSSGDACPKVCTSEERPHHCTPSAVSGRMAQKPCLDHAAAPDNLCFCSWWSDCPGHVLPSTSMTVPVRGISSLTLRSVSIKVGKSLELALPHWRCLRKLRLFQSYLLERGTLQSIVMLVERRQLTHLVLDFLRCETSMFAAILSALVGGQQGGPDRQPMLQHLELTLQEKDNSCQEVPPLCLPMPTPMHGVCRLWLNIAMGSFHRWDLLFDYLRADESLQQLRLQFQGERLIQDLTQRLLSSLVNRVSASLVELELERVSLDGQVAQHHLLQLIGTNRQLRALSLCECCLSPEELSPTGEVFTQTVRHHPSLQHLGVQATLPADLAVKLLEAALSHSSRLQMLDLRGCRLLLDPIKAAIKRVTDADVRGERQRSRLVLELGDNCLSEEDREVLNQALDSLETHVNYGSADSFYFVSSMLDFVAQM